MRHYSYTHYGFRKTYSTVHPLIRIKKMITGNFDLQKSTGMIYLIKIIQNFISQCLFRNHIGSFAAHPFSFPADCRQGSCLSPILYNLYTSDLPQLNYYTLSIFAEDPAVLNSEVLGSDVIDNLQKALNELHCYFRKWGTELNPDETQAICCTRKC